MELDEAVARLYGLHPDTFLAARRELAQRAKGDRDVGLAKAIESVRKPTAAAWAVNQLVRARPADVERLLALAAALHDAQERMDGAALKTLGRERTTLVDELVRTTGHVAQEQGGAMSAPVAAQIRETFVAALASTAAAEAVGSGQLTRALSYAGFGEVDLSEATAAPTPARRPVLRVIAGEGKGSARSGDKRTSRAQPEVDEAEDVEEEPESTQPDPALVERLRIAEKRSRETMSTAATAGDALTEASEALEALDAQIVQLETSLKEAKARRPDLVAARNDAAAANKVAERTLRAALAEVDQLRQQLPDERG